MFGCVGYKIKSAKRLSIGEESALSKKKDKELQQSSFKEFVTTRLPRSSMDTGSSVFCDPMTKCISILTEVLPDNDKYFKAVELLLDKEMQKDFIKMPSDRRLAWLGTL